MIGAPKILISHLTFDSSLSGVVRCACCTCYGRPMCQICSLYLHRIRRYERRRKV